MSSFPFRAGDFVWCAFPESEHPVKPSDHPHIGYVLAVAAPKPAPGGSTRPPPSAAHQAIIAYTTSQPWPHASGRPGVIAFSAEQAATLGQQRPFVLHLWRVAYLPVTLSWFPRLSMPGGGVAGSAPQTLRRELETRTMDVFRRHAENVEQLGPLRPARPR